MQLLRLEMKGFKSFADKTIVKFSPGMTAIVGPNGSGKSNITDAMRWVLGESNVRQLRGQKAEDIIFSGTEKRRPLSSAEVTLIFDNADKGLHPDFPEVAITRRIYRNGDSEFFINRKACRLKDIHAMFADTGLGRDSMAIIGQNRVDAILNSKPEERRLIFEEVAGIARSKMDKEEALRRMGQTERNMERLGDLMANLEEQLGPLAEKAEKTILHGKLSQQKRQYDGALAFHEYKVADRLFTKQENDKITLTQEDVELQTELTKLDANYQRLKLDTEKEEDVLRQLDTEFNELQHEITSLQGDAKLEEEKLRTSQHAVEDLQRRVTELTLSRTTDEQKKLMHEKLVSDSEGDLTAQEHKVAQLKLVQDKAQAAVQAKQQELAALQAAEQSRYSQQIDLVSQVEQSKQELQRLTLQLNEVNQLVLDLEGEAHSTGEELVNLEAAHQHTMEAQHILQNKRADQRASLQELLDERKQKEQALQNLRRQVQALEGRQDVLSQWEEEHEGYTEGTRNVLKSKEPWRTGVAGAIGDLFTVEQQFVVALDIALGGAINHVVAQTAQIASEGIKFLKRTQGGRATFLPIETVKGQVVQTPALKEAGVLGRAVDCIQFDSVYEGIFNYLLGRILIVDTMERAIALQKQYKQQLRIVTLGGEQFQPGGSLSGGHVKRRKASVMARKDELQQIEAQIYTSRGQMQILENELNQLSGQISGLEGELQAQEREYEQAHLAVMNAEAALQLGKERHGRKERILGENRQKIEDLQRTISGVEQTLQGREAALANFDTTLDGASRQSQILDELKLSQEAHQLAMTEYNEAHLACESLRQLQAHRKQQIEEWTEAIQAATNRLVPLQEELQQAKYMAEEAIPATLQQLKAHIEVKEVKVNEVGTKRQTLYDTTKEQKLSLDSMSHERHTMEGRLRHIQQRLAQMEGQLAKYEINSQQALARLEELGFTKEEGQDLKPEGAVADWRAQEADLRAQMEALGPINPAAVEEYEKAQDNHKFYSTQRNDLEQAKAQLETVIGEIDAAMSEKLGDVLVKVGERFQTVFAQLFGGGTAQIVLTDEEDILHSGIDFYIQPPGKKRQQLSLLSGGERALTVIALLFSFLDFRPAPFCVLDEVDAALDEANVERFGRYLQRLGSDTQFIVVSHRKRTMEAAQVLQGVTMVERGVSRLLTVAFEDVKEDM
ncbi:chromosome segregation protein SMC [uncultured Veillonella sp.]|uniref:chromosome segregation protein SMC n=1 Tax=uncultured Veillonella sp. TaxID=159268 RepID=UPI002631D35F|nr:chromosome segregation protein SMC [uncultured Veillonella sp.]